MLEESAALVEARYVYPDRGRKFAAQIRRDARTDRFAGVTDDAEFSRQVTARLRQLSGDGHFALAVRPSDGTPAESEAILMERWYGRGVNHGFETVERLADGIGYLDLRVFAPLEKGRDLATAAMSLLAQSPALIVDLRKNGGGMDDMVLLLAAYLLDEPHELSATYDRPTDRTTRHFTPATVPGRRFGGTKPVYILVSRRTFSAAEQFAYDLQAMKRAVVIGERTGGGAHPSEDRPVGDKFLLTVPEGRSINPVTGRDWEGTGVTPDIASAADDALAVALDRARQTVKAQ